MNNNCRETKINKVNKTHKDYRCAKGELDY